MKKAIYQLVFAPANPLLVAMIFMSIKVNLVYFKKKKHLSQLGKCLTCLIWDDTVKRTIYRLADNLISLIRYIRDKEYFYKVIYSDGTSGYIPKNDFDGVQVILL